MNATVETPVFLVEDDTKLAGLIKTYLERNHFSVTVEHDGSRAVSRILNENPSLVILDIMLPGKDGRTICRELRGRYNGPIVMLTALDEEVDQIVGLELGADDYITKPVRPRLLLSRINAMLRVVARSGTVASKGATPSGAHDQIEKIVLGGLEIHISNRDVFLDGRPLELTSSQFDLLCFLARHAGRIISRDELSRHLRGVDYDGLSRSIDLAVVRLREKIGDSGRHPRMIKSIRGEGYLMVKANPVYFKRAVQKILSNALRHAEKKVVICCSTGKDAIRIDILDDGPGIPENVRGTVFQPFTRLDGSRSRNSGGFGLGLAIVDRIVSLHGGTVSIGDNSPRGTRITTRWPADL